MVSISTEAGKGAFRLVWRSSAACHLHVLPRIATLPAGNIPVTLLDIRYTMLERIGLKHRYPDTLVADIAQHLRAIKHVTAHNGMHWSTL
jgi:hypothetical protein